MEFSNRLFELRKQNGMSQEELAHRLDISRQTISKYETGESLPDTEKLIAISKVFDISLDELVLGKEPTADQPSALLKALEEKVNTPKNKKRARQGLKIASIIFGVILAIDALSMIVYFILLGAPEGCIFLPHLLHAII